MILFVAIISGAVGTCVQWSSALEDGFVYIDLSAITKSAEVQCFVRDIASMQAQLVGTLMAHPRPGSPSRGRQLISDRRHFLRPNSNLFLPVL